MSTDEPAGLDLRIRGHARDQLKEKTTCQGALVMSLNSAYY